VPTLPLDLLGSSGTVPSCFFGLKNVSKTAWSTATGASLRIAAVRAQSGGVTARAVSGGDQRCPEKGVVQNHRCGGRKRCHQQMALFAYDRPAPDLEHEVGHVKLNELQLKRPRQWGACWLACELWDQLGLDEFWSKRLKTNRQGTRWLNVFKTLVSYRLIDSGSEWRLYSQWYEQSAIGDVLGEARSMKSIGYLLAIPRVEKVGLTLCRLRKTLLCIDT
jgi:hypothetical protein